LTVAGSPPAKGVGTGATSSAYVALLRGINLGGHHKVAMADLRRMFTELGYRNVATYIQSGNVVFTSTVRTVDELTAEIESGFLSAFGFEAPVALRSTEQLALVAAANPFVERGVDLTVLSVGFLAGIPDPGRVSDLLADPLADPTAAGGDEFALSTTEVYLHHPNGYGRTKLTNSYFDRRLGTMMTVRNWRTVLTVLDMAAAAGGP
jgi:uncharacterized protein (DUF1697 family)